MHITSIKFSLYRNLLSKMHKIYTIIKLNNIWILHALSDEAAYRELNQIYT